MRKRVDRASPCEESEGADRGHDLAPIEGLNPLDQGLLSQSVFDDLFDRAHLEVMFDAELLEIRHAGHFAVGIDDLDDRGGRSDSRETAQVDGTLGLSGANQSTPIPSSKWIDVTGSDEVVRPGIGIREHLDRLGAITGTDARSHPMPRVTIDADGERRLSKAGVVVSLRLEFESFAGLHVQSDAEVSGSDTRQEIDHLGGGELGRDHEVALVFTILVIDENDDATVSDVFDDFGDR